MPVCYRATSCMMCLSAANSLRVFCLFFLGTYIITLVNIGGRHITHCEVLWRACWLVELLRLIDAHLFSQSIKVITRCHFPR